MPYALRGLLCRRVQGAPAKPDGGPAVRQAALLVALLAACGPAHRQPDVTSVGQWAPLVVTQGWGLGNYELLVHVSWPPRQRQCLGAAVAQHYADWSTSRRGVLQVGRRKIGRIYLHPLSASVTPISSRTPNVGLTATGDGNAIHVRPADHRLPGLMLAIDRHQDPFLEGPVYDERAAWAELRPVEAQSLLTLYPVQQAIGCHP